MIGPNFPPQSTLRPLVAPGDPTLANPGFFDQAIMPVFSNLDSGLLPMMPLQIPGVPSGGATPTAETPKGGQDGMLVSKQMQEEYVKSIFASFMQSSMELQLGFGSFLGAQPKA